MCASPKDKHLLSGGDDRKIKLWSLFSPSSSLSTLDVAQFQLKSSVSLSSAINAEEEEEEGDEDGQEQTMPSLIDQTVSISSVRVGQQHLERDGVPRIFSLSSLPSPGSLCFQLSSRRSCPSLRVSACISLSGRLFLSSSRYTSM